MSDGLIRVSEAIALKAVGLEGEGANTLIIHRSKFDQEGEGAVQYIGGSTVARFRGWLDATGMTDGPTFQQRTADPRIDGRVSRHSLRLGGQQFLTAAAATSGRSPGSLGLSQHSAEPGHPSKRTWLRVQEDDPAGCRHRAQPDDAHPPKPMVSI